MERTIPIMDCSFDLTLDFSAANFTYGSGSHSFTSSCQRIVRVEERVQALRTESGTEMQYLSHRLTAAPHENSSTNPAMDHS